jgi:hypothetical protein
MPEIPYKLTNNGGTETLTFLHPEEFELKTVPSDHPRFDEIFAGVRSGDATVLALVDLATAVARKFEPLSDNVKVAGGQVYFDADPVDEVLTEKIVDYLEAGVEDWKPLVRFTEKLYTNIDADVRENLFRWLSNEGLTITDTGNILGYKGLNSDFTSIHAGPGIVNGVEQSGHLDNSVGNVLEMARSEVDNNPAVGCSVGLHVGTRGYATDFAQGKLVVVEVDPRNVVSVPYECNDTKMRVSKYVVREEAAPSYDKVYYTGDLDVDYDEDEDYLNEYDDDEDDEDDDFVSFYAL